MHAPQHLLITGATGLVGAHCVRQLSQQGYSIRAMYRTADKKAQLEQWLAQWGPASVWTNIQWVQADLDDLHSLDAAMQGIDTVIHTAACVDLRHGGSARMRQVNIEGTARVVNAALGAGVTHFLHISSIAALGQSPTAGGVIDENSEWNPQLPHSDYALSKYGAEMEVWRGHYEGLTTCILHPGVILAEGMYRQSSAQLWQKAQKGWLWYPKGQTAWTDIEAVLGVASQWLQQPVQGQRQMVITANAPYVLIQKKLAGLMGGRVPKWPLPYAWVRGVSQLWHWGVRFVGLPVLMDPYLVKALYSTETYVSVVEPQYPVGEAALQRCIERIGQHAQHYGGL